ncbi:hypothetical protein K0M31_012035 [Melipona bicolor]|uniref:Uncharacterized protein n=1 Tax=Melipona bicolor TaxID=60889 RepID=A0AA40GAP3_9HYME|nr:hypothetical protein K0M31_012035 [Melipona bicolor]
MTEDDDSDSDSGNEVGMKRRQFKRYNISSDSESGSRNPGPQIKSKQYRTTYQLLQIILYR